MYDAATNRRYDHQNSKLDDFTKQIFLDWNNNNNGLNFY